MGRFGIAALLLLACGACEGDRGPSGPPGPVEEEDPTPDPDPLTPTKYAVGEAVPRLVARIEVLLGASGAGGEFQVGDTLAVEFSLAKENGEPWRLEELADGEALVSGPTSNYQRVLPLEVDLGTRAVEVSAGRYRFTFPDPLPTNYAAPYNDTPSFGAIDGELAGLALQGGTYTVGLSFRWAFEVDGRDFRRVGEDTLDFTIGAGSLTPREVTSAEHCNRCHGEMQAHDGRYRKLELCFLCHTSGAEDRNLPEVAGGTPGVSIDSRVLFHRLHSGRFLPSVNGVTTRFNGSRRYDAEPAPLRYVRSNGEVRDFSHVGFPAMPSRLVPMPRDSGYPGLSAQQKRVEDLMRSGPVDCALCHGDPDGPGPIQTPAQGAQSNAPSRRACGSCHDDVLFENNYRANGQIMPPQNNDLGCTVCHDARIPDSLSPIVGHLHPTLDPDLDAGLRVDFSGVSEGPGSDGDGNLDPGETLLFEFDLRDDAGEERELEELDELRVAFAGPSANRQVLFDGAVAKELVERTSPYRFLLPERVEWEFLGDSSSVLDVFQSRRAPHRLAPGLTSDVFLRGLASGAAGRTVAPAVRHELHVDLSEEAGFAAGDIVVIDDGVGGREEYRLVRMVEGPRLWFDSGLRFDHPTGASLSAVDVEALVSPLDYELDPESGVLFEMREFGEGRAVLVSYTTDYVLPSEYPQALNGSSDLDDLRGKWTGLALVAGTYEAALSASREIEYTAAGITTAYRKSAPGATRSIPVGEIVGTDPPAAIDGASCNACHQDIVYHDGRYRGFETCILCHGGSGTEDLPPRVAAGAPETPARSVEFRGLLHRIHRGREAADRSYFVVASSSEGSASDYSLRSYHEFSTLPAFPGRTLECARCHGADPAELIPATRLHPDPQARPFQSWLPVCGACHDDDPVMAHLDSNTAPDGAEACALCHAPGEFVDVLLRHRAPLEPR